MSYNYDPAGDMERQRQRIDRLLAAFRDEGVSPMTMPNLTALNERLNAMINEMTRMQRALQAEIAAQAAPAMVSVPADELARLRGETDDSASKAAAKQSVAAGNPDAATRAKAEETKK